MDEDGALPAIVLAAVMLTLKPLVFRVILTREGETEKMSTEVGVRLGQISEFSLLIAALALSVGILSEREPSYVVDADSVPVQVAHARIRTVLGEVVHQPPSRVPRLLGQQGALRFIGQPRLQ